MRGGSSGRYGATCMASSGEGDVVHSQRTHIQTTRMVGRNYILCYFCVLILMRPAVWEERKVG